MRGVTPFRVDVAQEVLDDLQARLARTRLPDEAEGANWNYGTNLGYLAELIGYWQNEFDWRAQEKSLNRFAHFRADIDGFGVHFIHERGRGENPLPLVLTHGWPDSFWRFLKIIPLLTDPAAHGGDAADSFDVVVPSLPGYGFSDRQKTTGMLFKAAELWAKLMTDRLGYPRFAAHGGDWGSVVTEQLARSYAGSLVGIHLTDVPALHATEKFDDLSTAEKKFIAKTEQWQRTEGAYGMVQGTKPQSLGYGLNDSPAGLAAWIVEKFRSWSDCHGDVETSFTKDEMLTNVMIYWTTATINSSFRLYYDQTNADALPQVRETIKSWTGKTKVPAGFARFPADLLPPERKWAERFFNVQRWTEMPGGGHFTAFEEPQALAEDLRAFFRPLR